MLSGGERGAADAGQGAGQPSNLLVLDEPTNDLDLETLDLLEEMLADYPGTLMPSATTAIFSTAWRRWC